MKRDEDTDSDAMRESSFPLGFLPFEGVDKFHADNPFRTAREKRNERKSIERLRERNKHFKHYIDHLNADK